MSKIVKKKNLLKNANLKKLRAIDILGTHPEITGKQLCEELNINPNTLTVWKNDLAFIEAVYEKYMITFNSKLPQVQEAMIREAKEGNVQAARLVMDIAGKIVKRVNVKIQAPFQQWLDAKDAEIVDMDIEIPGVGYTPMEVIKTIKVDGRKLPKRNKKNKKPLVRMREEKERIKKIKSSEKSIIKKKKQFNSWYHLRKRAKKVGLKLLPPGKPTKTQRADWLNKLKELETKN